MRTRHWLAGFAASVLFLAGCGDALTMENYDQITVGMSLGQVEDLLGSGEQQTSGGIGITSSGMMSGKNDSGASEQVYLWKEPGHGGKHIVVKFKDGLVVHKTQSGL